MRLLAATGDLLPRLTKLVLLLGLLAGIPAGLVTQIGWPLPRQIPTLAALEHAVTAPVSDTAVLNLLAIALWILWAAFCLSLLVEIGAAIAGTPVPRIPGLAPVQPLAAWLVAGLTATVLASTVPAAGAVAGPSTAPARPAAVSVTQLTTATPPAATAAGATLAAARGPAVPVRFAAHTEQITLVVGGQAHTYTVHRGDNLSHIAGAWLGDPDRWPEIYHLNQGRHFPDVGGTLTNPDLIYPGWVLTLPDDARPPGQDPPEALPNPPAPPAVDPTPAAQATAAPAPPATPGSQAAAPDSSAAASARPSPSGSTAASPTPSTSTSALLSPSTTASPAPTPARSGASATGIGRPTPSAGRDIGVQLPGGWVPIPLAAALIAAAALVWLRRRHRYVPGKLAGPVLADPDLQPLPPAVTVLRRGVRRHAPDLMNPGTEPQPDLDQEAADASHPPAARNAAVPEVLPPIGPSGPQLAGLGSALPVGGLGLVGDGAHAAARAMLVATLSSGSPEDPDARGQVVIPVDALTTLLGVDAVNLDPTPRLTVTTNLSEALTRLDELLIERRRLLQDEDADDLEGMRAADPMHPPMPPVLLLAEVPEPAARARLTTTLHLGTPLQINAVLLGDWPRGDTLDVDTDGWTDTEDSDRLAVLDTTTTLQLLQVLSEAHTGQRTAPPVPEPTTLSTADGGLTGVPDAVRTDLDLPELDPADLHAPQPNQQGPADPQGADGPTAQPRPDPTGTEPVPNTQYTRVPIRVLGRPALVTVGPPKQELRKRALELLVYLVVHRRGANLPDIKEAFWPDASNRRAGERLQTETGDLRSRVRDAYRAANPGTEDDENTREQPQPVVNTGGRYHLNPDLIDVDWWTVQDALAAATTDTAHRIAHLRRAVDAFGGPLADGCGYDWLPDVAEHVRRQGIIAYTHLATLVADTDPAEAAGLLDQATVLDPINEDLARAAIQAHARLDDADAVRAAMQRLRTALDEIDVEPDEATTTLATDLLRQITGRSGQPRPPHEQP